MRYNNLEVFKAKFISEGKLVLFVISNIKM